MSEYMTGNQLRARRVALGLTQLQLAAIAGVSTRTVMRWEGRGDSKVAYVWYSRRSAANAIERAERERDKSSSESHVTSTSRKMSRDKPRPRGVR